MSKVSLRLVVVTTLVLAGMTAYAGGWAVVTIGNWPDYAVAGQAFDLKFTVRQHGFTLLEDLKPGVRARARDGLVVRAAARPLTRGEYGAALTLPRAGEWTIVVTSGFNGSATTLPPLTVVAFQAEPPRPLSSFTRGSRLFVAKGCVACHLHEDVTPEKTAFASRDLTGKRFSPRELARFLADPTPVRREQMPNLHLKAAEITDLVAFINGTSPE